MFYPIISHHILGHKPDRAVIQTRPGLTNMSREPRTEGWLGTTNDWHEDALGEFATVEEARQAVMVAFDRRGIPEKWVREDDERYDHIAAAFREAPVGSPDDFYQSGHGLSLYATDEEIRARAAADVTEAEANGMRLDEDQVFEYLRKVIDEAREDLERAADAAGKDSGTASFQASAWTVEEALAEEVILRVHGIDGDWGEIDIDAACDNHSRHTMREVSAEDQARLQDRAVKAAKAREVALVLELLDEWRAMGQTLGGQAVADPAGSQYLIRGSAVRVALDEGCFIDDSTCGWEVRVEGGGLDGGLPRDEAARLALEASSQYPA